MGIWSIIGIIIMVTHSFLDTKPITIGSMVLDIIAGGIFGPICIIVFAGTVLKKGKQ